MTVRHSVKSPSLTIHIHTHLSLDFVRKSWGKGIVTETLIQITLSVQSPLYKSVGKKGGGGKRHSVIK